MKRRARRYKSFINARSEQGDHFRSRYDRGDQPGGAKLWEKFSQSGDEIIVSAMEHHSNIVPWQMLCEQIGARLRVIPINHDGEMVLDEYRRLLSEKTKLVSVTHVSNALGTIVPVKEIVRLAHERNVPVYWTARRRCRISKSTFRNSVVTFMRFPGTSLFGPTGVGVLYGRSPSCLTKCRLIRAAAT